MYECTIDVTEGQGIVDWEVATSEFYGIQGIFCPFCNSFFPSLGVTMLDVRMQPQRKRLPQVLADGLDWT